MVAECCRGHLSLVALLKYKEVSFGTHQVIVLIVVLLMLMLLRKVLVPFVVAIRIGKR